MGLEKIVFAPHPVPEMPVKWGFCFYSYEAAAGYVVEFVVRRVKKTAARPHGIRYALVFRPKRGTPYVRFDNAHAVDQPGGTFVKGKVEGDPGRPYAFTTAM